MSRRSSYNRYKRQWCPRPIKSSPNKPAIASKNTANYRNHWKTFDNFDNVYSSGYYIPQNQIHNNNHRNRYQNSSIKKEEKVDTFKSSSDSQSQTGTLSILESKKRIKNLITSQDYIVFGYIRFNINFVLIPDDIINLCLRYYHEQVNLFILFGNTQSNYHLNGIQYINLLNHSSTELQIYDINKSWIESTLNSNWDNGSNNSMISYIPHIKLTNNMYNKYRKCLNLLDFGYYNQFSSIIKLNHSSIVNTCSLSMILFPNIKYILNNDNNYDFEGIEIPINITNKQLLSTLNITQQSISIYKENIGLCAMFNSKYLYQFKVKDTDNISINCINNNNPMKYKHNNGGSMCFFGKNINKLFICGPNNSEIYSFYGNNNNNGNINNISRPQCGLYYDECSEYLYIGGGSGKYNNIVNYWNINQNKWYSLPKCLYNHFDKPLIFKYNQSPSVILIAGNYASNIGVVEYFDFRLNKQTWLTAPSELQIDSIITMHHHQRIRSLFM